MSEVEQIESRIKNLSPEELAKLRAWFAEFDAEVWDWQIEADTKAGKLNQLIEQSLAEHHAGESRPL
jgi:succinate dehydrogenase flavin-adding protein (antitoxin of CptAB toxin-antitoxin module)